MVLRPDRPSTNTCLQQQRNKGNKVVDKFFHFCSHRSKYMESVILYAFKQYGTRRGPKNVIKTCLLKGGGQTLVKSP